MPGRETAPEGSNSRSIATRHQPGRDQDRSFGLGLSERQPSRVGGSEGHDRSPDAFRPDHLHLGERDETGG